MRRTIIEFVKAREILDSRGNPTISTRVRLRCGATGTAAVPSGASTGTHEALELRDGEATRYLGKGVLKAVANVNTVIAPAVQGLDACQQENLDNRLIELDGTPSKQRLGANAVLSVSLAAADAAAKAGEEPLYAYLSKSKDFLLPVPLVNILNGGSHADNNVDIQEFMIVPVGFSNFRESIRAAAEVFQNLKKTLKSKGYSTAVGDEGGFAPNLKGNEEALELILTSIARAGYEPGKDIFLALDVAASELFDQGAYAFKKSDGSRRTSAQMTDYYAGLLERYPIISVEDAFSEDDWEGWKAFNQQLGSKIQTIGDDVFVTNLERLKKGIQEEIANAILIKLNQIGTLSETVQTVAYAQQNAYNCIISHRSGETEDTFIADLSVALSTGQIKSGSLSRSERVAKYNRLLDIEEELGSRARYAGRQPFVKYLQ